MATVEVHSRAEAQLREDANEPVIGREPQIRRMKALSARPGNEDPAVVSANTVAPAPLRRPGMATRWKGQHRLAISG